MMNKMNQIYVVLVSFNTNYYIPLNDKSYLSIEDAEKDCNVIIKKLIEIHGKDHIKFQIKPFEIKGK